MVFLRRHTVFAQVLLVTTILWAGVPLHSLAAAADGDADDDKAHVLLSFSTVGDSRQDPINPDPTTLPLSDQDRIWLQNTKAWSRILHTTERHKPDLLFFNGDMIMGYGKATVPMDSSSVAGIVSSDLMKFYRQYGFWRGMVAGLLERGTYVVPVPGNHETQCNTSVSVQCSKNGKNAERDNEEAWRANMGDLILDTGRFQTLFGQMPLYVNTGNNGGVDELSTDQSKLSYSFDFRGLTLSSSIPIRWGRIVMRQPSGSRRILPRPRGAMFRTSLCSATNPRLLIITEKRRLYPRVPPAWIPIQPAETSSGK